MENVNTVIKNKRTWLDEYKAARRCGVSLMAVNCFDPAALMDELRHNCGTEKIDGEEQEIPMIKWDVINGMTSLNGSTNGVNLGRDAIKDALGDVPEAKLVNPVFSLEVAAKFPKNTVFFILNGHYFLKDSNPNYIQAFWNLRDLYKIDLRTIVLLAPQVDIPMSLQHDVLVLDEALPDDAKLEKIIRETVEAAKVNVEDRIVFLAVDALRGLSTFAAEQSVAMCVSKSLGIDIDALWGRKRQLINNTPGLMVWKGGEKFEDLGGLDEVKKRFTRILNGKAKPRVIVWIDEIEKTGVAAGNQDTSGTSQDQFGVLLTEMQEKNYNGAFFVGVPGAAKSAMAKAIANEAGVVLIKLDFGGMKKELVGSSEGRVRQAMKIIEAVGGEGGAFFIATSNDISAVKTELKRRFKKGIWFFDLPTVEERQKIWELKCAKFGFKYRPDRIGFDTSWTGAEIEACVQTAWEEDITFEEAAKGIIPVAVSGREVVEGLRREAHNRYNSTNHEGAYVNMEYAEKNEQKSKTRKITAGE